MTDSMISGVITVVTAIVGVAIIAVIVSRRSDTANVVESAGRAVSGMLEAAVSPVSGGDGFTGRAPAPVLRYY